MLRCCFGTNTQQPQNTISDEDTFETQVKERGLVVDLWLSQKVLRMRSGSNVFVCRRTNEAEREKSILKKLASGHVPHIVHVLEDIPCTVCCTYIPGLDLTQCALNMERVTLRKTLTRVADVLVFCHERRIVHLDVKPENIVVACNGSVKLIDFEYALNIPLGSSFTRMTYKCGTLGYVAPEVLIRGKAYLSSDAWSFGCLVLACCGHIMHVGYPGKIHRGDPFPIHKAHSDYYDLLKSILVYNPEKRANMQRTLATLQKHDIC